jgi:isopentenyl-diphosphate delta-isomerase
MPSDLSLSESSRTRVRKDEHLDVCLSHDVASTKGRGWHEIRLPHVALPDANCDRVELSTDFLGHSLKAPFLISSMTGGSPRGEALNRLLARLAEDVGIAMGVGSQRVALENRDAALFDLRRAAPRALLFANIGAVQLNYGVTADDCAWLVERLEAGALILHANPLQEAIQKEGDRDFRGLWTKIESLKKRVSVPLILKETGCGLDEASCRRAIDAGVDALDSAGMGGTHWGFIEGLRHSERAPLGEMFRDWGIPSVESLGNCVRASAGRVPVVASGGLRSGLDVAKALRLGATLGGMALPFLDAASHGEKALSDFYSVQQEALRIAVFCSGHSTLREFQKNP